MSAVRHSATWETASPDETIALGTTFGRVLDGGLTVALIGPLGAGKTHLVKGIAAGNAVDDMRRVTSPTFTIVHEYPGRWRLIHVDAYRLPGARDLAAIGFEELSQSDSVVVVEWADRVHSIIPSDAVWVTLCVIGDTARGIEFTGVGARPVACVQRLCAELH